MKRCVWLIGLWLFPVLCGAAEQSAWQGPGTVSCAEFSKAYHDSADNENLFFSWALGFMSGLNAGLLPNHSTDLHGLDMAAQKQSIKSFCKDHPRAAYFEAVFYLFNQMRHDQGLPSYFKTWNEPNSK